MPKIRTESAIIIDLESGNIILGKNEENVRSIASLTKLATALVFLSTTPDLQSDRNGYGCGSFWRGTKSSSYWLQSYAL